MSQLMSRRRDIYQSSYHRLLIPDHCFEPGDELCGLAKEPVPRPVINHDEVGMVTI